MSKQKNTLGEDYSKLQRAPAEIIGKNGIFQSSVEKSLKKWDKTGPFVALELGCGGGQNFARLCKSMVDKVRAVKKDAKITVFQMDRISKSDMPKSIETLKKSAQAWLDKNVDAYVLSQSFYDTYDLTKAIRIDGKNESKETKLGDLKVNFIFSQSALHWCNDFQKLTLDHLKSDETKKYGQKTMLLMLDKMAEKLTKGGVVCASCLGILNDKGWKGWNNTVVLYSATWNALLDKKDSEKYLENYLPQVPRRLCDIEAKIKEKKTLELLQSGQLGSHKRDIKMDEKMSVLYGKAMMSPQMWKDRFAKLFPNKDLKKTFEQSEVEMAKALRKYGLATSDMMLIYFVFHKI